MNNIITLLLNLFFKIAYNFVFFAAAILALEDVASLVALALVAVANLVALALVAIFAEFALLVSFFS